ncbi:hypothetical protein [Halopiger aswanensis]|uniref:DUF8147 domain-containing protein n=1 Tax=Halopiger aswanensis TaxID=148449 RepID=A0A3R7E169_9EURY|nr:hypothetical protein [Halopiger aswanensis]RKD97531.1 hypothetical protein ATJ93_0519 [Halopiger aswanensis]
MSLKTGVFALVAGIAAFFGVGIGVTAITAHWIEFSVFLGLLTGTIAGAVVTIAVSVGFVDDVPDGRQRIGGTAIGFGVGFVAGIVGGAALEPIGTVSSLGVGLLLGVLVAVGVWRYTARSAATPS